MADKTQYGAGQIQVLEGLEPVRKRPGMYIGSTGPEGLHHLIWEIVNNSIDEALAGFCRRIDVELLADGGVRVADDGRGIPVDKHEATGKSAVETVLTKLHAGGKFGGGGYKVSGGLHGVGISVVNALSTKLQVEVKRDNKLYAQDYAVGVPQGDIKVVGDTTSTGTIITFWPDGDIFEETEFDFGQVLDYLRHQAYLTKGVFINLSDQRTGRRYGFCFQGGIKSYVQYLNRGKETLGEPFYVEKAVKDSVIEIAISYNEGYSENIKTFANNILNPEGGTHLTGFKAALTRVVNDYARKSGLLKDNEDNLTGEDCREGIAAVISVKLPDPQFEGQTKSKLGNPEIRSYVEQVMGEWLNYYMEEHPSEARKIIAKSMLSARARIAARAARDTVIRKGVLEGMTLPGKLADCSSKDPHRSELFIVEGESAGGSAKSGRNREFQAILPLRGKILNVERARLDKMLANNEIKNLIIALGTSIGEQFDISKLRYERVIIMTDADVDGAHIRTLLLTFFYRHMPDVINDGHLYIAQPPLYLMLANKKKSYAYSDEERDLIIEDLIKAKQAKSAKTEEVQTQPSEDNEPQVDEIEETEIVSEEEKSRLKQAGISSLQRYKGLGEMNADQLWETTMDPDNRMLLQVSVDDAEKADAVFTKLMGEEVMLRKNFIQAHAKQVTNLDI